MAYIASLPITVLFFHRLLVSASVIELQKMLTALLESITTLSGVCVWVGGVGDIATWTLSCLTGLISHVGFQTAES